MYEQQTPTLSNQTIDGQILSIDSVTALTTLSRTTIWRLERSNRFPKKIRISPNRVGFKKSEIVAWVGNRGNHHG